MATHNKMFDFLDSLTLLCGGDVSTTTTTSPDKEAASCCQQHGTNDDEAALDRVDPMNAKNYLVTHLSKPLGILLEENYDEQHGGAFVAEINEGCSAAVDGSICRGDQLIAIGDKRVSGMDFDEIIKLIFACVEMKTKLAFFRGPAESLYGPSGASKEWLDEYVAERGEEAALVEEEDSESEVVPDIADVAVSDALLYDAAVAAADVDADTLGETEKEAAQILADVEARAEKDADAAEEALVIDNKVEVDGEVECEVDVKNEDDGTDEAVLVEEEEEVADEAEIEKDVEAAEEVVVIDNEDDVDEEVAREADVVNEAKSAEEVVVIKNDGDVDEQVAGEAALETDASILSGAVKKASKDWLDSYFANSESQLVSCESASADTLDEPTEDLETRSKKAAKVKEAALAVVVDNENSSNCKSILKESRYSPKGVEEIKMFEPSPVDTKESLDDDSAASSVWSEAADYIVVEEVPVQRVGSSLAAMGVASTLTTNMMSS